MVRLIEKTLRDRIVALSWVGQYGAIIQDIKVPVDAGEGQALFDIYPISRYVSASDCFDREKWKDLIPDDKYASVCYFEQRGSSKITMDGPKDTFWVFKETLRFVAWLNYPKLGLDFEQGPERFALNVANTVYGNHSISVDGIDGELQILSAQLMPRDFRQIFGRFSYADKQNAFFRPYDFFAVDFECKVRINAACLADVSLGSEVECVVTF